MKAECLIFRKLTPNEFKAITNTINSEGGGSQTYIDFPKGCISDEDFKDFFQNAGSEVSNGFEWEFYVNSLSIGRNQQKEVISARRSSSNSLREQNNNNRIEIWKPEVSGFPSDAYDDKNDPIIVFILRSTDNEFWAGWFYRNKCDDTWPMTKGLSSMLWKDCAYIKFDSPIPFDINDFTWPFMKKQSLQPINWEISNLSLQRIYYGAPGTGKSHEIDRMTDKDNSIRTTFHPDSDYASFIGTYKPTMQVKEVYSLDATGKTHKVEYPGNNYQIVYKFIPQAFLTAYVKAWEWLVEDLHSEKKRPFYLVIEEINRGNCAQIFGDMFQLLDRSGNGISSYSISPDMDVQQFLENDKRGFLNLNVDPDYIINNDEGKTIATLKDIKKGTLMVLPSNLHILATMNTSDQSLFPIDSAFKRRWDWEYKKIKDAGKKWKIDFKIDDESDRVDWWRFIQKVNAIIGDMTLSADKQLGYFFCKPDKKKDSQDNEFTLLSQEKFVGKVLFYLWNDVFKDYGFDDASLFKYIDLDSNGKEIERDLAFADFYDDANKINSKIVCHFISNVMKWNKNDQTIQK